MGHIVATVFLATALAAEIAFTPPSGFAETTNFPPVAAQQTAGDFFNRGNAEKAKGDLDGVIADYNRAIELDPKNADTYIGRGNARKAKGDKVGADEDFAQAVKLRGQ
jgi:Flp pilus assembly protein TadD